MSGFGNGLSINNVVVIILVIVGLVWLIYSLWRNWKISRISAWPKTNATVLNALALPAGGGRGNVYLDPQAIVATTDNSFQYVPKIVYTYRVAGKEYQSDSVIYSGARSYNSVDIKTIMGNLHAGSLVPVFYNPNKNNESYIYNGTSNYTGAIIGIILLFIAGFLSYYHNYSKHKHVAWNKDIDIDTPNLTEIENRNVAKTVTTVNKIPLSNIANKNSTVISVTPSFYRRDFY